MSSPMEKLGAKASSLHAVKRSKQAVRCPEKVGDHSDVKNALAKKLSEIEALHETILDERNRLIQENVKLTQELCLLKEENKQAIATKDKDIEELKRELTEQCEKLEQDINEVESLVKRNKELENKNKELLERDLELSRQLCELQEKLVSKDKIIRSRTMQLQSKHKDVTMVKEKTEQLLHIYEKSMKEKLRNISDICTEICSQSSSATQDDPEEAETTV